jgi:hypothetical protein
MPISSGQEGHRNQIHILHNRSQIAVVCLIAPRHRRRNNACLVELSTHEFECCKCCDSARERAIGAEAVVQQHVGGRDVLVVHAVFAECGVSG